MATIDEPPRPRNPDAAAQRPRRALPPMVPATEEQVAEVLALQDQILEHLGEQPQLDTHAGVLAARANDAFLGLDGFVEVELGTLPGPEAPLATRTFVPDGDPSAVVLDIHGGGWCLGSAAAGDLPNQRLADRAGVVVVSLDYRLAPEHPWPAGADDCEAAARWLLAEAPRRWGCDRLVLAGESAGAHLALVTLLRLRDRDGAAERIAGSSLAYGAYDLGMTPSQRAAARSPVIDAATLRACYQHLLAGSTPEDRRDPSISPLYAELGGLGPALFSVGTRDALLDDSLFLAARWAAAGDPADLDLYPECPHGFPAFPLELARVFEERRADWIVAQLRPDPPG